MSDPIDAFWPERLDSFQDRKLRSVTQAAGETGSAATQVLGAAGELSRQATALRSQVDDFLGKVRAA